MAVVFPSNKDSSKLYSGEHVYRTVYKSRNLEGSIMIENLTYSDHNYTVRLSQKFTSAPDVEKFWSNDVVYVFKTKPSRPRKSPRTTLGAFYANRNNVRIFWEQLEQKYWSGPNFTYSVSLCDNYQVNGNKHKPLLYYLIILRCLLQMSTEYKIISRDLSNLIALRHNITPRL